MPMGLGTREDYTGFTINLGLEITYQNSKISEQASRNLGAGATNQAKVWPYTNEAKSPSRKLLTLCLEILS
ncbi:hypothetical protein VNO77_19353 [Canavalia gladiata]|uniref:Uncharacterized protein n=1 Tax=Canavalia gladiata TaxID=3824 RepID=A0AAN9LSE9_CANGL